MEIIQGKSTRSFGADELAACLAGYRDVVIDLGTGDGRFVLEQARAGWFAIGVDACRENLRAASRSARPGALFVIANARSLPAELYGLASRVTINFPWGSLLEGLLQSDPALLDGLGAISRPGAALEVRLNASALQEQGWALDAGGQRVYESLAGAGFHLRPPARLDASSLRGCPSTWAKRLAFGRSPHAVMLQGRRIASWISVPAGVSDPVAAFVE